MYSTLVLRSNCSLVINYFTLRLTKVVISNNIKLSELSICWFNVPNLRHLDLSSNALESLPSVNDQLWQCKQLNVLQLQNNRLTVIPQSIHGAVSLKILSVAGNHLTNLPPPWNCSLVNEKTFFT